MNRQETLALYEKGKKAWNAWAEEMLAEKKRLEEAGEWAVDIYGQGINDATRDYLERAKADFTGHRFDKDAVVSVFVFPGDASFIGAQFSGNADFIGAKFTGPTDFLETQFTGDANFDTTKFEEPVRFDHAIFSANADFSALEVKSAFSLAGANFRRPPDFIQAHFEEGPRLDHIDVLPTKSAKWCWKNPAPDLDTPAKWRALKRLAIQAHDHEREQEFFKYEILSRRWEEDQPRMQDSGLVSPMKLFQISGGQWFGHYSGSLGAFCCSPDITSGGTG